MDERERLLDELGRCFARAAVERLIREQEAQAEQEADPSVGASAPPSAPER